MKVIDNTKWEYKLVKVKEYEIGRSDTDKIINERLEGTDGWEAFDVKHYDYGLMIFLKRKYIEVNNDK